MNLATFLLKAKTTVKNVRFATRYWVIDAQPGLKPPIYMATPDKSGWTVDKQARFMDVVW